MALCLEKWDLDYDDGVVGGWGRGSETQPHGPEETFVQPIMLEGFLHIRNIHFYSSPASGSCVEEIITYLLRQVV